MAELKNKSTLTIIVPSLNESKRLPLLFADLKRWPAKFDLCLVDGGSNDETCLVARLAGARLLKISEANRGAQLHNGTNDAIGEWFLFLHADSRLTSDWSKKVEEVITHPKAIEFAWFFNFKVKSNHWKFKLLEFAVALRSQLLRQPYGDQGLLISKDMYQDIGGYSPLHLMEDLDIILRLSKRFKLQSLGIPLYTNGRKWEGLGLIQRAWKNAELRRRWRRGESTKVLSKEYYSND